MTESRNPATLALHAGWRADPARVWATLHDLALDAMPVEAPFDLFHQGAQDDGDAEDPVRADGYLRPDWAAGAWATTPERLARWIAEVTGDLYLEAR